MWELPSIYVRYRILERTIWARPIKCWLDLGISKRKQGYCRRMNEGNTVSISEKVNIFYLRPFSETTNKATKKKYIHQHQVYSYHWDVVLFIFSWTFSLLFIVRRSSKIDFAVFVALHFLMYALYLIWDHKEQAGELNFF